MIPETVGKYRVVAPLGQGRVGVVYRGLDPDTERPVALKLVPAEHFGTPAARQKFLEEARATASLSHPHLRQLYDAGESGDQVYLAMEYVEGSTLKNLLIGGALEPETALAWGEEVAEALGAAHAAGLAHGELTPAKVFITEDGTVKVLDVGLWRLEVVSGADLSSPAALTNSRLPASAVAALAPEQVRGAEPDARSDVFALGVLLYQMTTGRHPFADPDAVQTMQWVLDRAPENVSEFIPAAPRGLDAVLTRALAKEPAARYENAGEVAAALRAIAAGEELPAPPSEAAIAQAASRAIAPYWFAIGGGLLLLVLWFLYLALTRS